MNKKWIIAGTSLFVLGACGNDNNAEESLADQGTIVFGQTAWTSTEAPTEIVRQILEEMGYDVDISLLDQPVIFEGMQNQDVDFFMDAWLPYTEAALWEEYEDELIQVTTSYEDVPLGWVVPESVPFDSISDLEGNADMFDGEVVTIGEGAGIVDISREVIEDETYGLDDYELIPSSEAAMLGVMETKMQSQEPFILTGWRPHSMFSRYDLKFLEDPEGHFNYDNVYVLSYDGIQEDHPEAYALLSQWSISVSDLEDMMYEYEHHEVPFEETAAAWIEENRDRVDEMIEQAMN
ncbi:glycine betaine ABC transporter substrate-binding protein [Salisediminibacterium beveridgei]|uniref:Glycine betaine ABC transport system, glycine betaine-binding protein OpuAC n=1 Tax=Salisediminibacterium beveridgei TaxID=632773 RepID=A0A1D7QWW8_9BACI|nr:glycine betaine ABC transporter substrate-binding protein [Salisediminibacterium beveridgei]AOM83468.1 Glycine betaine ABC transport system, glycine betaine-binding protein OpuAC [Salisediminibacterium beveridgei]